MPEPWSHGPLGSKGGRGGKADGLRQHGGRARGLHPPESRPFLNRCSSSEKGALPRESRGSSHSKEPGAGCSRSRSPSPVFNGRSSTAAGLAAEPPDSQGSTVRSRTRAASTGPAETAPDARSSTGASSSTARLARPLRTSAEAADAAHPQWSPALVYPRGYVVSFLRSDWMALGGRTRTRPGSAIAALAFFGLCEPDRLPRLLLKAQLALCLLALLDAARHLLGAFAPALTASSLLRLVAYALLVPEVARARTAALLSFGAAAELLQSGMVIGRGH
ncbi:hypothetical protein T492DRAFT_348789 [Pavlovales sp. CCMP2436]|nr:hypothetical protein T492DRAFT_348789 [Pavlovales sp. CCMP2436]